MSRCLAVGILVLWTALPALALDAARIGSITGLQPSVSGNVVKVTLPRADLAVRVGGVALQPFQGLTSWAAFQGTDEHAMVMGDLTLAENEVAPTMDAALQSGLEVTALHNHFAFDRPRVMFMHVAGAGDVETLATAVRRTFEARSHPATPDEAGIPAPSSIDAAPLEAILGPSAQTKDGMVKFVFGRTTSAHGTDMGADMGVSTWAVFAGTPQTAVVDGDFAMLESELQGVLKALRAAGIGVVAIHSHMTGEDPRIMFLHFWGRGPAAGLARGIQSARATQRTELRTAQAG
jgi:hypothetical protein